jgi:hypothetical protein
VAGSFVYSPVAGTLLNAGASQILSADFFPTDTVSYHNVPDTTVVINVLKAPTTLTITDIFPGPSTAGDPVTVVFDLDGTFGTPGGTITVTDGVDSCTAAATATSCTMTMTTPGTRTITAAYSGDDNHFGSSAAGRSHRVEQSFPTARVDGSTAVCEGASASVRVRLTGLRPWTLTWSDGTVESTSSATHHRLVTPGDTTSFSLLSVRARDGVSGEVSGAAVITVRHVTPPQIIEPTEAELGGRAVLRATPGYTSYQWFRNGLPIAGATSEELVIDPVTEADFTSCTVMGMQAGCSSSQSEPQSISRVPLGLNDAVIPVVGTVHGINGSLFRTTVHLSNPTAQTIRGEITFIDENVPSYEYTLVPGETRFIEDLLPPSFGGLTSANVRRTSGPLPVVIAHIFNDEEGPAASGMIEHAIPVREALNVGDRAVLITPIYPQDTRFNLGIRSLGEGLRVQVTRRDAFGTLMETFERELGPSVLIHEPLLSGSGESLTFEVLSGGGVIYGAATDNGTNDPNMQIASKVGAHPQNGHLVLPVAGSGPGLFDSYFSTAFQVHNPGDETLTATLYFIPTGARHTILVEGGATVSFPDVLFDMKTSGIGSLEFFTDAEIYPIVLARIYSIEEEGQASLMTDLIPIDQVLASGHEAVVIAPHSPAESRFNLGMRTFGEGVRVRATVRNAEGAIVHVITLTFERDLFLQDNAAKVLAYPFTGDESVSFLVDEGSAVIYGVWTNNVTQDPAMHYAQRF